MGFWFILKLPSRNALSNIKLQPSKLFADSKSPFVKEGSSIFILSFLPFEPSSIPSIVPMWSAVVPFPIYTLLPTTDTLSIAVDAVATVLSLVVSLFNSASFNDKSIYDPEKNAFPYDGTWLSPKSINLLEFVETSLYIKFSLSVPLKVSMLKSVLNFNELCEYRPKFFVFILLKSKDISPVLPVPISELICLIELFINEVLLKPIPLVILSISLIIFWISLL